MRNPSPFVFPPGTRSLGINPDVVKAALEGPEKPAKIRTDRYAKYTKTESGMNKLETQYAKHLEERKYAGEIESYLWDSMNFRLGPKCYYKPDFMVFLPDLTLEIHETKGFMEEDALVKIKACIAKFHLPLILVKRRKGKWEYTRYEPRG